MAEEEKRKAVFQSYFTDAPKPFKPLRVGVILLGEDLRKPALKFLILSMNAVQKHFEYEIFAPEKRHDLLSKLSDRGDPLDRSAIKSAAVSFLMDLREEMEGINAGFSDRSLPHRIVVITLARFSEGYYSLRRNGLSVIALGDWRREMAPPSILEFIQALLIRESVAGVCPALSGSVHYGTRGCICDFTPDLSEARLKVLNGFVCSECSDLLEKSGLPGVSSEIVSLLSNKWLGKIEDLTSRASVLAKFGTSLFITSGLQPTWKESVIVSFHRDFTKEMTTAFGKMILYLIGLVALFYLGIKAS